MPTSYEDSGPLFLRGAQVGSGMAETAVRNQRIRQQIQEDAQLLPLKLQEAVLQVKGRESQLQTAMSQNVLNLARIQDMTRLKEYQIADLSGENPTPPAMQTKEGMDTWKTYNAESLSGQRRIHESTDYRARVAKLSGIPFALASQAKINADGTPTAEALAILAQAEEQQLQRTQAFATEKSLVTQDAITGRALDLAAINTTSREAIAKSNQEAAAARQETKWIHLAAQVDDKNRRLLLIKQLNDVDKDPQIFTTDAKNAKKAEIAARFGVYDDQSGPNTPAMDPGAVPQGTNSTSKLPVLNYNSNLKKLGVPSK